MEILIPINGKDQSDAQRRTEIFGEMDKTLSTKELEKLLLVVKSDHARDYLNNILKWITLKTLLGLK